jgi:hypothetical protein
MWGGGGGWLPHFKAAFWSVRKCLQTCEISFEVMCESNLDGVVHSLRKLAVLLSVASPRPLVLRTDLR